MSTATCLLISGDEPLVRSVNEVVNSEQNCHLVVVPRFQEVLAHFYRKDLSLVLIHTSSEEDDQTAARLIQQIQLIRGDTVSVLVLSDEHRPKQARAILRLGAVDYLIRPLDLRRLSYLVDVLTVRARFQAPGDRSEPLPLAIPVPGDLGPLLCCTRRMKQIFAAVRRVARQETTILLSGETGTGKTRVARLIHELSPRSNEPFLVVNCGALPASLIESELFGHVKGAFTGADRDRTGKFAEARRGTLLLDEVDATPLTLQTKLLRAAEERTFEPVGSNQSLGLSARLIAASNRSLDEEVAAGRFRSDLYYRLNVVEFKLPSLRESRSAIRSMAMHFVADLSARVNGHVAGISDAALRVLERYSWPGNVRELRNAIERAVALCTGRQIQLRDLPEAIRQFAMAELPTEISDGLEPRSEAAAGTVSTLAETKIQAEIRHITSVLRKHCNNRTRTAQELGISRVTLYKKLRRYGILGEAGAG